MWINFNTCTIDSPKLTPAKKKKKKKKKELITQKQKQQQLSGGKLPCIISLWATWNQCSNDSTTDDLDNCIITQLKPAAKECKTTSWKISRFSEEMKNLTKEWRCLKTPTTGHDNIKAVELSKTIDKKQWKDLCKHTAEIVEKVIKQDKCFKMAKRKLSNGGLQFVGYLKKKDD